MANKTDQQETGQSQEPELNNETANLESPLFPVGRIKTRDITAFLRQLLMLVESGTPLVKGLRTLSERTADSNLRTLISEVCSYVEAGNPLWQALEQYPKYFSPVFVNLIKAGEASGTVPTVLRRLIEFRDRSFATRRKVKSALIYPTIVVIAAVAFLFVVSKLVVPAFQDMFAEVGAPIPAVTQCVIGVANIIGNLWFVWLILVIVAVILYKMYAATPAGRIAVDRMKLRLPGFGRLLTSAAVTDFTRTFALLLRSGVSILVTLDLTKDSIQNRAFGESLTEVRDSIERGEGLEAPLRANNLIPAIVTDMLVTGEESGTLDDIAEKIADIYQEDLDVAVDTLSGLIEPVLAIVMGGIVLILVLTLFLPYVTMIDQISGSGL
ncbi:MAG: type II secretion system F family protein [Candidatus Hydrogenedentes bacterium]|nr:type II secretion system F family protein [Candidatus Hydrogenedentota bacterium]